MGSGLRPLVLYSTAIGRVRLLRARLSRLPSRHRVPVAAAGLILAAYLALKALAWLVPLPDRAIDRPTSTLVFARDGQLLHSFISQDDMWRIRTPLEQVSPQLQAALLGFEDRWFYLHPGVNPVSIGRALIQNARAGRIVSGGSTITMQIARMMEPKPRTVINKSVEMLRAFQLELRYSKRRLLEIYFNIAPYGGNIEGVAAASWLYFGKEPSGLSLGEAALLVALPNSPNMCRPDTNPTRARSARDHVLRRLWDVGVIDGEAYRVATGEGMTPGRRSQPRNAPHFCRDLARRFPGESRLYSTIDTRAQDTAEDLLRKHLSTLRGKGISNGAVVVIDNRRHEVAAMVGSGDFNDTPGQGQVNGALALRSPGSALKPFVYARAMGRGLVSPAHYLEDVPSDFAGYSPENFDRTYNGLITVRSALERSLNVPAVWLERELGGKDLYDLLRHAGVAGLRSRGEYGLSIAIGGCEITLLDLTALYSCLASGGRYVRPRQAKNELKQAAKPLLDPGASFLVTDVLTGLNRPDLPSCWEFTSLPRVAWKTGTSYGRRDAWSVGYNPRYTVGVWLGNFTGVGARDLVGAEAATPVLFDILSSLCRGQQIPWFRQPSSVGTRSVCALSGQVPGPFCPTTVEELYLVDRSPVTACRLHCSVQIDDQTGCRLPPHYPGDRPSHALVYIQFPARVGTWLEATGRQIERLPPLLPGWQGLTPGEAPIIRSPSEGCEYRLREGIPPQYQKICLEASVAGDAAKLFWFLDGTLVGSVKPGGRLFIVPVAGNHRLVCQDDLGRSSGLTLVVKEEE